MDIASLVCGILGIFMWPIHWLGLSVGVAGLISGILVLRKRRSGLAVTGIILVSIGIVLTLVDLKFGLLDTILKTYFQT